MLAVPTLPISFHLAEFFLTLQSNFHNKIFISCDLQYGMAILSHTPWFHHDTMVKFFLNMNLLNEKENIFAY